MKNLFNHPAWIDISLLLARLALGIYMLIAGWIKMAGGVGTFVDGSFMKLKPEWLPDSFARPYGYALPFLELVTGLGLALGLFTRISAGIITLLLISIAIAVISEKGLAGGAPGPIHPSVIFATLALVLMVLGSGRLALDPLYFAGGESGGGKKK
ncbi:MAG: DoxX family protein [Burkholderiales bacterium]|nr:DoxX family protein [Phycisphaerae bacterium]